MGLPRLQGDQIARGFSTARMAAVFAAALLSPNASLCSGFAPFFASRMIQDRPG